MTVEQFWQERLQAGFPMRDLNLRIEGYDVRSWSGKTGQWPRAIARQSLYHDYLIWHRVSFLPKYDVAPAREILNPTNATELQFFIQMGPWLYIDGKDWHVKNYSVKKSERHNGEWVRVKGRRYFIRLLELDRHIDVFERSVGRPIRLSKERLVYT